MFGYFGYIATVKKAHAATCCSGVGSPLIALPGCRRAFLSMILFLCYLFQPVNMFGRLKVNFVFQLPVFVGLWLIRHRKNAPGSTNLRSDLLSFFIRNSPVSSHGVLLVMQTIRAENVRLLTAVTTPSHVHVNLNLNLLIFTPLALFVASKTQRHIINLKRD